jgi:cardiolipin synthase A/B
MVYLGILIGIFIITVIALSVIILLENRNPTRTMAWILVLIFLPVAGIFLYLYIGQNHRKKKTFIKKRKQDYRVLKRLLETQITFTQFGKFFKKNFNDGRAKMVPLILKAGDSPITFNNEVKILNNGAQSFTEMLKAIENAKDHIHMEFFIIKDSEIGRKFQRALIQKAKEGLEVRLIYDAVGSWKLTEDYLSPMRDAGIQVEEFLPVTLPFFGSRLNYRNHRKILVVDGKVGFTGGINIGDEYLGKDKELGFWRDTHVKIFGEANYVLQTIFLKDWYFVSSEELDDPRYFPRQGYQGEIGIQILSSGPDMFWQTIQHAYFTAITAARKSVYITTPYLIPDEGILMALKSAGLRGVDVRILLPSVADHRTVFWASKSHFKELLEAGVKIYQYQKGFIHSKIIMTDDNVTSIGTANFDIRSLELNFEVNAFIYDEKITQRVKGDYFEDLRQSKRIYLEEYEKRAISSRLKESVARLFSPIL